MKRTILILTLALAASPLLAQKKTTTSASLSFDATTPKDALPKAENKTVIGSIDTKTGAVAFEASVKNFAFSNPRMYDHFIGENWFNADSYPSFTFTGKIDNLSKVKFTRDGEYKVTVSGDMKVRDVTNKEKIEGTITVSGGKISVAADFTLKLDDYKITGAPIESGKVAKVPTVSLVAVF